MTAIDAISTMPVHLAHLRGQIRHYRFVVDEKMRRVGRAWRYLLGRTTLMDAYDMSRECEDITGCYSLETLDVDNVIKSAGYRWTNWNDLVEAEELGVMAGDAARRVASRWSSTESVQSEATSWALDKIKEYAEYRGIELEENFPHLWS